MMALFIVLWLSSSPEQIQKSVARYFRDPSGSARLLTPEDPGSGEQSNTSLTTLEQQLWLGMRDIPNFDQVKANVRMTVTGEGLRIELMENDKGTFFQTGQATPTRPARDLLIELAKEVGRLPNRLVIEGHTDSRQYSNGTGYSNWELSMDRANAARKLMQQNGLKSGQILQVSGFADHQLRLLGQPDDPSNRRISIIVSYAHPVT
jgi:chemotaxis protein MotB